MKIRTAANKVKHVLWDTKGKYSRSAFIVMTVVFIPMMVWKLYSLEGPLPISKLAIITLMIGSYMWLCNRFDRVKGHLVEISYDSERKPKLKTQITEEA